MRNKEKQAKGRRKIFLNKRKCSQQSVLLYSFKVFLSCLIYQNVHYLFSMNQQLF